MILFATGPVDGGRPIQRVAAVGGTPTRLGTLAPGETSRLWPQFLPDGRRFIYLSIHKDVGKQGLYVGSLDPGHQPKFILATDAKAMFAPPGYLLFLRGSTLMAQRFDVRRLQTSGEAFPVADWVARPQLLRTGAAVSASSSGVLAYWNAAADPQSRLAWFDRAGRPLGAVGKPAYYSNPAISPDEKLAAVGVLGSPTGTRDIWVFDLARGFGTQLTEHPHDDFNPAWSPDGLWVAFTSTRRGGHDIFRRRADGSGGDELLFGSASEKYVEDWSGDGRFIAFNTPVDKEPHVLVLPLFGERKSFPVVSTKFVGRQARFSPDGRWLAYSSFQQAGRSEVYVDRFSPGQGLLGKPWRVSLNGGKEPHWRGDGKELFYLSDNQLMAVEVKAGGDRFELGIPKPLFRITPAAERRNRYAASKDGRRFLVNTIADENRAIHVVVNWDRQSRR